MGQGSAVAEAIEEQEIPPAKSRLRTIVSWSLKLGLVAGIFVYLSYNRKIQLSDVRELFERWPTTLLAMSLFIPCYLVCAIRYRLLLRALGVHARFSDIFSLNMIGTLFDLVAPVNNGGDLVKAVYLARSPAVTGKKSFGLMVFSVVLDRIIGLFALFTFALIVSALAWPQISGFENLRRMVAVVVCVCLGGMAGFFILVSEKLENSPLRKRVMHVLPFHHKLEQIYSGFAGLRHHKFILLGLVGLSILNHFFNCASVVILSQGVVFLSTATQLPAALPIVPCVTVLPLALFLNTFGIAGGFGVGTVAFEELFKTILGLQGGAKLALAYQISSALFRLLGIPFLIFYRHKGVDLDVSHVPDPEAAMDHTVIEPAA